MSNQQDMEPRNQGGGGVGGALEQALAAMGNFVSGLLGKSKTNRVKGKKIALKGGTKGSAVGAGFKISPADGMMVGGWVGGSKGQGSEVINTIERTTFEIWVEEDSNPSQ